MLPYLSVGGLSLPSYSLLAVLGVCAAYLYAHFTNRAGKAGRIPAADVLPLTLVAGAGALAGAKFLSLLTMVPTVVRYWPVLAAQPALLVNLLLPGLVFYGGLAGGLAAAAFYGRRRALPSGAVRGVFTPAIPLFHVFGRIGCFLAGCCWGVPVRGGVIYTHATAAPNGVPLLPVSLIEAACNAVLFFVLAVVSRRLPPHRKGAVMPLYLGCYGALRFGLEFFRGDAERGVFLFSTSQWISLLILSGLCLRALSRRRRGKGTAD